MGRTSREQVQEQEQEQEPVDEPPPSPPPEREEEEELPFLALQTAGVFAVVLAAYVSTAYPYVSGGDSGELVVAACNWGVAHPPGYPLFTVLAALAVRLVPIGACAWRVNVLCCAFGAGAAATLFATGTKLTRSTWSASAGAFGFAFSPTVWLYAIQSEVFPLNNLLVAVMALCTVRFFERPSLRHALEGAWVSGLASTNQHTVIFFILPTTLAVLAEMARLRLLDLRAIASLTAAVAAGLSWYLYVPLAALSLPKDSWGDQRTMGGFVHHFLRREYGTFQLAARETSSDPGIWVRLGVYVRVLVQEESLYVAPVLAIIGLIGLICVGKSTATRKATGVMFVSYVVYLLVFSHLANLDPLNPLFMGVQARFWQQINMYVFLWAGAGFLYVFASVARDKLLKIAVVVFALLQFQTNFISRDHSQTWAFRVHGERILNTFPNNSIVLLNGDLNNNIVKYPHECERVRPDLHLISLQLMTWEWFVPMQAHHYPGVVFPGDRYHPRVPGGFSLAQFLVANMGSHAIFLCGPFKDGDDSHRAHFDTYPVGHCDRILPRTQLPTNASLAKRMRRSLRALPKLSELGPWEPERFTPDTWEHVLYFDTAKRLRFVAAYTAFHSNKDLSNTKLLRVAVQAFDRLFEMVEVLTQRGQQSRAAEIIIPEHRRDAGIVYGQWSAVQKRKHNEKVFRHYEQAMLKQWRMFIEEGDATVTAQIIPFVRDNINPYTGTKILNAP